MLIKIIIDFNLKYPFKNIDFYCLAIFINSFMEIDFEIFIFDLSLVKKGN